MSDDPKHPKDDNKTPPKNPQENLHRPEATWMRPPQGAPMPRNARVFRTDIIRSGRPCQAAYVNWRRRWV